MGCATKFQIKVRDILLNFSPTIEWLSVIAMHPWLNTALQIENSWEALADVAKNVEDILECEDFDGDPVWFSASVPIQWEMPSPSIFETVDEWNDRLKSLRSMNPEDVIPIILFLGSEGKIRIIDGHHRIAMYIEMGCKNISALVRYQEN